MFGVRIKHAAVDGGSSNAGEIKKEGVSGRRKIEASTRYTVYSGAGDIPVDRYCYRFAEYAVCRGWW
ncbi:hypothetical protein KCP76_07300 [Salmonella enterica subsp. enterica serovar Weltevreden]|nr:hypothetical protein KCP76_07300 [Salmonella enterica subsp. enterica serovar Weltevreden]